MSKINDLYIDVEEQLMNGAKPEEIAKSFGIPVRFVYDVEDDLMNAYNGPPQYEYDQMD